MPLKSQNKYKFKYKNFYNFFILTTNDKCIKAYFFTMQNQILIKIDHIQTKNEYKLLQDHTTINFSG